MGGDRNARRKKMKETATNIKVVLVEGISQKGNPYSALRLETGDKDLDKSLKLIFLNTLQLKVLRDI